VQSGTIRFAAAHLGGDRGGAGRIGASRRLLINAPAPDDFRDGEAMAREWIAGRGDLPDLPHIVRDMPRGGELGGLERGS
jgi:hypothetical protein